MFRTQRCVLQKYSQRRFFGGREKTDSDVAQRVTPPRHGCPVSMSSAVRANVVVVWREGDTPRSCMPTVPLRFTI